MFPAHDITDLRGTDDWFADPVASASHHLLRDEDLLCWDFNPQISTGHHDAVTSLKDLIKSKKETRKKYLQPSERYRFVPLQLRLLVLHPLANTLMVLQLADDLDVLALLTQDIPDSVNVSGLTNERGEDHVNTLLHAKLKVLNVLLRHRRQVNSSSRQIDALLAAQHTAVLNLAHQVVTAFGDSNKLLEAQRPKWNRQLVVCLLTNFFNLEGNQTIINIDVASNLHNLGDVFVVQPQSFLITVLFVLVVECDLNGFALFQLNFSGATLKNDEKGVEKRAAYIIPTSSEPG